MLKFKPKLDLNTRSKNYIKIKNNILWAVYIMTTEKQLSIFDGVKENLIHIFFQRF